VREHPEGLSPAHLRRHPEVNKELGSTIKTMARDRVLQRVEPGRPVVPCGLLRGVHWRQSFTTP
jgi:hypothetical protein